MDFSLFDLSLLFIVAGFVVGVVVGLTGVGGGSLMTPILLYFGVSPATAVGTDLLYAAATKSGGIIAHHKQQHIDWRITGYLALGSIPAAIISILILTQFSMESESVNNAIKLTLAITIILTALAMFAKDSLLQWSHDNDAIFTRMTIKQRRQSTVLVGFVMGILVAITSIGAGVLGTVSLFLIYPLLPVVRIIGTEIAHAVPLTLIAGLGHVGLGNVDWQILFNLLIGSLPGIYIGSHLPAALPEKTMRYMLAVMLVLVGIKILYMTL